MINPDYPVVVIDRAHWGRGWLLDLPDSLGLRITDNRPGDMCCLGFMCKAFGHTDDEIKDYGTPSLNHTKVPEVFRDGYGLGTLVVNKLVHLNDKCLHNKETEEKIAKVFAENGVKVEFVGTRDPKESP